MICRAAELVGLPTNDNWELGVTFVGDRAMARANADFVGHNGTTDVITFVYFEEQGVLPPGDSGVEMIICADAAEREGMVRKSSGYARELALYIVHGLLHAAGEDDLQPGPRRKMRRREREVMAELEKGYKFDEIFI